MRTICILLPAHWDYMKGGAEYQADCFAEYLKEKKDYDVVYLARDISTSANTHNYEIIKIPTLFKSHRYGLFWDGISLYKKLAEINPDVILQHIGCAYTGIASFYCKKHMKGMIWHIASDIDVEKRKIPFSLKKIPRILDNFMMQYGIKQSKSIIAQTSRQADLLKSNYNRDAEYVIPNFHPIHEGDLCKNSNLTVLWVANIKKLKQPELFVRLANECEMHEDIKFKLIGRNENTPWCDSILSDIAKSKNIEYLGEMTNDQVNKEIEAAHILVNTSVYEGFPNTFIQAWMREVPTLSLNVDPDGVIQKHNIGLHAKNIENMRGFIVTMRNSNDLHEMGRRARKIAEENYSMKNADRIIDIIESYMK